MGMRNIICGNVEKQQNNVKKLKEEILMASEIFFEIGVIGVNYQCSSQGLIPVRNATIIPLYKKIFSSSIR